jgi:ribosomal subunit interface protein
MPTPPLAGIGATHPRLVPRWSPAVASGGSLQFVRAREAIARASSNFLVRAARETVNRLGSRFASRPGMMQPLQITFRDIDHSDALEAYVRQRADKLDTFFPRIVGCHVALESPHRRRHAGRHYRVRIDLTVPGNEIVVSHAPSDALTNQDLYAAIDQAFDQVGRRLEDHARRTRGDVKVRAEPYRYGRVVKHFGYEGYGFIASAETGEVYFHRNSVQNNAFDRVKVGSLVRFVEELGDKGPQASTVVLAD